MKKIAVVTGAGSGVGRAVVLRLAQQDWNIALIGRSKPSLDETIQLAHRACHLSGKLPESPQLFAFPCDVAKKEDVEKSANQIRQTLGDPTVLVNSAGINIPNRAIEVLSTDDFDRLIETNLNGTFYCIHAFLPAMRTMKGGTIVNIISDAGILANAKAGGAYAASKFGVRGLTQAINFEQHQHGIRACAICPGDINTPLLEKRPTPPTKEAREKMLQPEDVAECVMLAINLPENVVIEELLLRPL
jgi:NAD(P)-dependent dehydrogenase (short-subunit alcohol dehydrogenase family)